MSGSAYNAEALDAATGMINLRARQYEHANRFGQKDIFHGLEKTPMTLNRYLYVANSPVRYADPSGGIATAISNLREVNSATVKINELQNQLVAQLSSIRNSNAVSIRIRSLNGAISN